MANPYVTANAPGSFLLETQGFIQGDFWDDPSGHMWLAGGTVISTATVPVWGGLPIEEFTPAATADSLGLGPQLQVATTVGSITGFVVYNQAASMVTEVGNSAPIAYAGNYVSFLRSGSKQVRVAVQCDPALATANTGASSVAQQLSWNFTDNRLEAYTSGTALNALLLAINTNSKIINYDSGTGAVTWTTGTAALIAI